MRFLRRAGVVTVCLAAALVARSCSRGAALDGIVRGYLSAIESSDGESALGFLTDSLSSLVGPDLLTDLADGRTPGRLVVGSAERRGLAVSLSLDEGGSRTFWLRSCGDDWRISGESSLDNLLGAASMTCLSYARETLVPAVTTGEDPSFFVCPVTGDAYFVSEGMLLCPAGHLDPGLDIEGSACAAVREELATEVTAYLLEGYPTPASLSEMYQRSDGVFGRRSGYRCPDDGYSYYELTPEGIHCPYHGATTAIPLPEDTSSADGGAA